MQCLQRKFSIVQKNVYHRAGNRSQPQIYNVEVHFYAKQLYIVRLLIFFIMEKSVFKPRDCFKLITLVWIVSDC